MAIIKMCKCYRQDSILILYISNIVWVLLTPNAGRNIFLFNVFNGKKLKKGKKQEICRKFSKKIDFLWQSYDKHIVGTGKNKPIIIQHDQNTYFVW